MPSCPLDRLNLPHSRKCLLLLGKKVCFWPFVCMHRWGLLVSVCVHPSGVHVISLACQWTKCPAEYWELLSKQCGGMEKGPPFFMLFEQSWPALHAHVGFAPELGRGPSLFPNSHCPAFFFYTCCSEVAVSPTALLLAHVEVKSKTILSFDCSFGTPR